MKEKQELADSVNRSGFLFQWAIEHSIKAHLKDQAFLVASTEHPWSDPETGDQGFIDIVLEAGFARIVIECKRPRGGTWMFLVPNSSSNKIARSRLIWTLKHQKKGEIIGVDELFLHPGSYESEVCIIRGHGEDERTLLERYSWRLLTSVSSLAQEEVRLKSPIHWGAIIYIPVIITSANLMVAQVDPANISLSDGTIDNLDFQQVPYIKFRKSLATALSANANPIDLSSASKDMERTIFVIHGETLVDSLRALGITPDGRSGRFPWDQLSE